MNEYKSKDFININENISVMKYMESDLELPHIHDFIEIEYMFKGSGFQEINGVKYSIEKGDVFFLNVGDTHSFHANVELGIYNCLFNPNFFSKELINSDNALDILNLAYFKEFSSSGNEGICPKVSFLC